MRNFVYWQSHLNCKGLERNGDLLYPLDGREVWHIAKSVSKWTWRQFDIAASDARFSALQAHRGHMGGLKGGVKGGMARSMQYEDKRVSARLMKVQGHSYQQIADALKVSRRAVIDWCK